MVEKTNENTSFVVNENINPDSIEWRLSTGKSVKVYCDAIKKEEAKQRITNAINVLLEIDREFSSKKEE